MWPHPGSGTHRRRSQRRSRSKACRGSVDVIKEDQTQEASVTTTLIRRAAQLPRGYGLDLICTKVAVDFQSISLTNAEERLKSGLQELTDAYAADSDRKSVV